MSQENKEKAPILFTATKDFTVERQLKFSLKTNEYYKPGEETEVELNVYDQLDNPVKAETSLSLVEEALFSLYPDTIMPITSFFSEGMHRDPAMRTVSSCAFSYKPLTRQVLKELLDEDRRLAIEEQERQEMEETRLELKVSSVADRARKMAENGKVFSYAKEEAMGDAVARYYAIESASAKGGAGMMAELKPYLRQELAYAGYWTPAVVTDANGKAKIKITMPEKITQWRMVVKGCTTETLVGHVDLDVKTRKEFFVEAKLPSFLQKAIKFAFWRVFIT